MDCAALSRPQEGVMPLQKLDERGWIFLDEANRPYLVRMWGDNAWLFWWHPEQHWVSLRQVTQSDVWSFPKNLSEEEQQAYRDAHDNWDIQLRPSLPGQ